MSIFSASFRTARQNRASTQAGAHNGRNNSPNNNTIQNGMPSAVGDMGSMLRARREAMGATLAEAEAATRIRQKYIAALEAEEWALLPGEVVGRGFLRNYAAYLGLEPTEILERRRAVIDSRLASALSSTSAGAQLPGTRAVDYRPKEMDLKDEPDGITRGEIRMTPFLSILLTLLALGLIAWGLTRFGTLQLGGLFQDLGMSGQNVTLDSTEPANQTGGSLSPNGEEIPAVPVVTLAPITVVVNPQNTTIQTPIPQATNSDTTLVESSNIDASNDVILLPTATIAANQTAAFPTLVPTRTPIPTPTPISDNSEGSTALSQPTATPPSAINETGQDAADSAQSVVLQPTEAPNVEPPTPVPTLSPVPTSPPAPSPPQCPDWRTVLSAPFNNEVVQGLVQVRGTATHEDFRYYRIEYAFGANATSGFTYFTGGNAPVFQGVLGQLDTTSLPNETYTIRVAVIDSTGNFSPPCQVTLIFAN